MTELKQFSCGIFLTFLVLSFSTGFGQKVKYKDLYELLRTKQYETAEPFLKRYLTENDDNPNAFLFMGIIYQEKAAKEDFLEQTERELTEIDSAIYFFNKATSTIDDRELRKNKDYYEAYNRRDLRTGEYGVSLSDVQFDLQKRLESLKERSDLVKDAKRFFVAMQLNYDTAQKIFTSLQGTAPNEMKFYLRADDGVVKALEVLSMRGDSAVQSFNAYKVKAAGLGHATYNQMLDLVAITNFAQDGTTSPDFYQDDLKLWDYKKFADNAHKTIQDEIQPMEKNLLEYDIEINKLREKLTTDSVSVKNDLTKLIDKLFIAQLKKYDPDPMPVDLFALKVGELEYKSTLIENKKLRDSADVFLQLKLSQDELAEAIHLDSIATKLANRNLDEDVKDYELFVKNTFHSPDLLKGYVRTVKDFADREYASQQAEAARRKKALDWIIDGNDSIPLKPGTRTTHFMPMTLVSESYTAGLYFPDSIRSGKGYFYTINPSRLAAVKVRFPIDSVNMKRNSMDSVKMFSAADTQGQIFFVMFSLGSKVGTIYPATLCKIYRSDGLAWSNNIKLPAKPEDLVLDQDSGSVKITYGPGKPPLVIDKNGKVSK